VNQSVPLQFVQAGLAHFLSDVLQPASQTTVAGTLQTVYLGLFTAGPAWAIGNVLSQYTEANYAGYARQQIVWGDRGIDANSRPNVIGSALQFQPTGNAPANTIVGAMLCDAVSAGNLLAVGQLTQSKVLGQTTDTLTIVPRFAIPGVINPVDWGEIVGIA
jgi:hypothetical protein